MKIRNIYITKHSPYEQFITIKSANGTPTNITGYVASMFLAKHYESETKYTVAASIHDATNGVLKVSLSTAATAILPVGNMVYSVFVQAPPGVDEVVKDEMILVQGVAIIEPSVHT